ETSSDGAVYTIGGSVATASLFALSALRLTLYLETFNTGLANPGKAAYASLNLPPPGIPLLSTVVDTMGGTSIGPLWTTTQAQGTATEGKRVLEPRPGREYRLLAIARCERQALHPDRFRRPGAGEAGRLERRLCEQPVHPANRPFEQAGVEVRIGNAVRVLHGEEHSHDCRTAHLRSRPARLVANPRGVRHHVLGHFARWRDLDDARERRDVVALL